MPRTFLPYLFAAFVAGGVVIFFPGAVMFLVAGSAGAIFLYRQGGVLADIIEAVRLRLMNQSSVPPVEPELPSMEPIPANAPPAESIGRRVAVVLAADELALVDLHLVIHDWKTDITFGAEDGQGLLLTASLPLPKGSDIAIRRGPGALVSVKNVVLFLMPIEEGIDLPPVEFDSSYRTATMAVKVGVRDRQFVKCQESIKLYPEVERPGPTWRFIFDLEVPWRAGQMILPDGSAYRGKLALFGPFTPIQGLAPVSVNRKDRHPRARA